MSVEDELERLRQAKHAAELAKQEAGKKELSLLKTKTDLLKANLNRLLVPYALKLQSSGLEDILRDLAKNENLGVLPQVIFKATWSQKPSQGVIKYSGYYAPEFEIYEGVNVTAKPESIRVEWVGARLVWYTYESIGSGADRMGGQVTNELSFQLYKGLFGFNLLTRVIEGNKEVDVRNLSEATINRVSLVRYVAQRYFKHFG